VGVRVTHLAIFCFSVVMDIFNKAEKERQGEMSYKISVRKNNTIIPGSDF